jgi:hypothetical protein
MFQSRDKAKGLWPALIRACGLLVRIAPLVTGATDKVRVEKAQVFFSKSGSSSHKLHYSNIKQDFDMRGLYETDQIRSERQTEQTCFALTVRLNT